MSDIINSSNNPKKNKPKIPNLDFSNTQSENNSNKNNNNESLTNNKKLTNNNKIISQNSYTEINSKTQIEIKQNTKSNQSKNSNTTNNIYKEIRRPLNRNIPNNTLSSSNANSNYKIFGEKIQNLDIIEHTENSFLSPETEAEGMITNANCDTVKVQENLREEENEVIQAKENNVETNKNFSNNKNNNNGNNDYENNNFKNLIESNVKNSKENEKSNKINYRFESPVVEHNSRNYIDLNNSSLKNSVSPNKKISNYSKNSNNLKAKKVDKWENKSYSHYTNKQASDKINNSMLSNFSNISNLDKSLKISISNGIIDINQYEIAMSSTKHNKQAVNNNNINSDTKENNPSINFISSIINNKNLFNNNNQNNILAESDFVNENNNEKLVFDENEKANSSQKYKRNNKLCLGEKSLRRSGSNFKSKYLNDCDYNNEEFGSQYYNEMSTDKQNTLEKHFNENHLIISAHVDSKANQGDLSNLKEDRRLKRNRSGVQSFVQLNKSDVGKIIQEKLKKEAAAAAASNNSLSLSGSKGNLPEKQISNHLKNEMLQLKKNSKSNNKLINLNDIDELTEETTGNNIINDKNKDYYDNKNTSISNEKKHKLSRSPKYKRKKSENNKVLISKNSLYMEKVLFFVDNLQKKTNKISQKFEDEFLVLKSEKNGAQQFEKKYIVPPNYINLKSNEIIEKNKSFKKLEKTNGKVKLFEIFSNETLDNYNKDRHMVNDLDLKEKFFYNAYLNPKNLKTNNVNVNSNSNNSFNYYNKQKYLNTSLNNKQNLNNSHQIYNYGVNNGSFENSIIKQKPDMRSFLPQPKIILRDDIVNFDREREQAEESKESKESFKKFNIENNTTKKSFKKAETKSNTFINNTNNNQTKSFLENQNEKTTRLSRVKNSPLIISAENILNFKNQNNNNNLLNINDLQEYENQMPINQSSFLNKSNYSQDLKNFQNEYWQKRRSEPNRYNSSNNNHNFPNNNNNNNNNNSNNNYGSENSNYFFNESLNNDLMNLMNKENAYRSSELELKKAFLERSKFEELKNLNDKNVEKFKHQKKIEFKNDVVDNRKKMNVIESAINKMVVEATHKAKDNMDLFMYNSFKDELITIQK